jgi:hypothetical protein
MATTRRLHDYCTDFLYLFPSKLHRLSRTRGREIHPLQRGRSGCEHLFPNVDLTHLSRICDVATGDRDSHSGVSTSMGSASADRSLDHADLAVCFCNRGTGLSHALQVVPATEPCAWLVIDV